MLKRTAAIALAISLGAVRVGLGADLCNDLKRLTAEQRAHFAAIKGGLIDGDSEALGDDDERQLYYRSTLALPNTDDCKVMEAEKSKERWFSCRWNFHENVEGAQRAYDE